MSQFRKHLTAIDDTGVRDTRLAHFREGACEGPERRVMELPRGTVGVGSDTGSQPRGNRHSTARVCAFTSSISRASRFGLASGSPAVCRIGRGERGWAVSDLSDPKPSAWVQISAEAAFPAGTPRPQLRPIGSRQSQALGEALKQQDVELGSWGHRALKLSRALDLASLSCDHCWPFHPDPELCLRHGRVFWGHRGKEETRIPDCGPSLGGVPLRQIILFRDTCLPREP